MADQIEQMTVSLETNQKVRKVLCLLENSMTCILLFLFEVNALVWFQQISDLQEKYDSELQHSADLSKKLEATEVNNISLVSYDHIMIFFML